MIKLEIACNSFTSCLNAFQGGANRIELFENLHDGGCTPSYGMIKKVKQSISLPIFVMIRPRGGDFCYTHDEIDIMLADIEICKQLNVDGIVFGTLTDDGAVDIEICKTILQSWKGAATFHRAIDQSNNLIKSTQTIISLGFERILTSGGKPTALEGMAVIEKLQNTYGKEIEIMAGAGIVAENVALLLAKTKIQNIHATCKNNILFASSNAKKNIKIPEQFSDLLEVRRLKEQIEMMEQ